MESYFRFLVPAHVDVDLAKSNPADERRIIRGFASTPTIDRQDESIVQKGLIIDDFINHGWFNYDHDNTKIVGYPNADGTKILPEGFWVEGELLKGVPLADSLWELAVALKKSQAPRCLGFSVEGKVLERDKVTNRILKARVFNVAITPNPVNPTATWEAVCKSFSEGADAAVGAAAGYTFDYNTDSNGPVLKPESLEASLVNLSYLIDDDPESKALLESLRARLRAKGLTKSEAVVWLQLADGLSRKDALTAVNIIYS